MKVGDLEDLNNYNPFNRGIIEELLRVRRMIVVYYSISDVLECIIPSLIVKKQIDFFA